MRTFLIAATLLTGVVAQAPTVATAQNLELPSPSDNDPSRITISCYRGPTKTVAWDRANAVFLDDLRQLGYTHSQATDIGERVCRDEYGVDNFSHMRQTLLRLMQETPPGSKG